MLQTGRGNTKKSNKVRTEAINNKKRTKAKSSPYAFKENTALVLPVMQGNMKRKTSKSKLHLIKCMHAWMHPLDPIARACTWSFRACMHACTGYLRACMHVKDIA